jgi:hypothetical protein
MPGDVKCVNQKYEGGREPVGCDNTHTPDTARSTAESATPRSHPQQPAKSAPPPPAQPRASQKPQNKAKPSQPPALRYGNKHDKEQKKAWGADLEKDFRVAEHPGVKKASSGKQGFTDVRATSHDGRDGLLVEIKTTNLDKARPSDIARHVRQVKDYMGSNEFAHNAIQAAIQYEHRPVSQERAEQVENAFADEGITCVFLDD